MCVDNHYVETYLSQCEDDTVFNHHTLNAKQWSEAAIGEDKHGNILFIHCKSPYSMHDFNQCLLKLPIDIVSAQHLEGGPEASLVLNHPGKKLFLNGSYETGFNENDKNQHLWPLPNVFGITRRK